MTSPRVSVLLAARRTTHLGPAIDSVFAQTFSDFELLLLDDSIDGTVEAFVDALERERPDPRVRRFPSARLGAAGNHARGVRAAIAPLVAIINHDDVWEPTLLATLIGALDEEPSAVVAFSDHWMIDVDGAVLPAETERMGVRHHRADLRPGLHDDLLRLVVVDEAVAVAQSAVWRREAVTDIPTWAGDRYDFWIGARLGSTGRPAVYVAERLARFRQHDQSLGSRSGLRRRVQGLLCDLHLVRDPSLAAVRPHLWQRCRRSLWHLLRWPGHVAKLAVRDLQQLREARGTRPTTIEEG